VIGRITDTCTSAILREKPRRGHHYWSVATSGRVAHKPQAQTRLYLGRLDGVDPSVLEQKRPELRALGEPVRALQFDALLVKLNHPEPLPSLRDVDFDLGFGRGRVRPRQVESEIAVHDLCRRFVVDYRIGKLERPVVAEVRPLPAKVLFVPRFGLGAAFPTDLAGRAAEVELLLRDPRDPYPHLLPRPHVGNVGPRGPKGTAPVERSQGGDPDASAKRHCIASMDCSESPHGSVGFSCCRISVVVSLPRGVP
jgi:hypothetical protein